MYMCLQLFAEKRQAAMTVEARMVTDVYVQI